MKVLITGASGFIGTVIRDVYKDCDITLLSRTRITTRQNEQWYQSLNIGDGQWWSELPVNKIYDVVFHLAEPVKQKLDHPSLEYLVKGHIQFINSIINNTSILVYPLTAYLYDKKLSSCNKSYAEIKKGVFLSLYNNSKISFPIIHPLSNYGCGLSTLVNVHRKVPFVNFFCRFNASLPILLLDDLKSYLSKPDVFPSGKFDLYSKQSLISDIFYCPHKNSFAPISSVVLHLMKIFSALPMANLLVTGRAIQLPTN